MELKEKNFALAGFALLAALANLHDDGVRFTEQQLEKTQKLADMLEPHIVRFPEDIGTLDVLEPLVDEMLEKLQQVNYGEVM